MAVKLLMSKGYFWCHSCTLKWPSDMENSMSTQFKFYVGICNVAIIMIFYTFMAIKFAKY